MDISKCALQAKQVELEFVGFYGGRKIREPKEKPSEKGRKPTTTEVNPHMTRGPGIEPGPHWWRASALITAPSLPP